MFIDSLRYQERHDRFHVKRDVVTEVTTVTNTAPEVVVIVDPSGNPVMTSTVGGAASTPAPSSASSSSSAPVAETTPSSVAASSAPASSAPVSSAVASSAPASSASPAVSTVSQVIGASATTASTSGNSAYGISYSPYDANSACKTQDAVNSDIAMFNGYGYVRLYGTDCNQTAMVLAAGESFGLKVFAGVYNIAEYADGVQQLIDQVNGDWSRISSVSIGNEDVNTGAATVSAVTDAVNSARSTLSAAGYTGSIVHVDVYATINENPDLCNVGDYVAANCHPYFAGVAASDAGSYVLEQAQQLSETCSGKNVVITETGWPTGGQSYESASPSVANQKTAIASLRSSFSNNLVLFSAFNDLWKQDNAGTYGTEHYWGFMED